MLLPWAGYVLKDRHNFNLFLPLFSLKNCSEDRDFQVLLWMKDRVWVWTWRTWVIN